MNNEKGDLLDYMFGRVMLEGAELLFCFVEICLLYSIYDGLFEKYRKVHGKKLMIILVVTESLLVRLCNHISAFSYVTIFIFVIYMGISTTLIYRISVIKLLSIASFYALCLNVFESFVLSALSNLWNGSETIEELVWQQGFPRICVITVTKAIEVLICFVLHKMADKLNNTYVILAFSCVGFVGYIFLANQLFWALNSTMTDTWFLFITLIFLVVCVFYFIVMQREEKMKLDFAEKRNYLLEENYKSIQEIYMKNAKLYHDLNNHLNMLYQILDERDVDGAKEYIEEISRPIKSLSKTVWTGVDIVDVILNSKIEKMEQKNISYECNVEFPKHTNLLAHDICTILANLLDNAIEASEQLESDGHISLTIRRVEHFLLIKISNICIREKKPFVLFPLTTKENRELHGWGLSNVKDAVDKYNGTMKCTRAENLFTVNIMLFFELINQEGEKF